MAIVIFDRSGAEQDWPWLVQNHGALVIHPSEAGGGWRVVELREQEGPAAIIVTVKDAAGAVVANQKVAWYWPDADADPNCGPANGIPAGMVPNRCDLPVGKTNAEGVIGLAMGGGAYYYPPNIGPHATWIYGAETNSDVVFGLGMIGGTNHRHLNVTYQWTEEEDGPGECPWDQIFDVLDTMERRLTRLVSDIQAIRALRP